jgi:hypothetical protein
MSQGPPPNVTDPGILREIALLMACKPHHLHKVPDRPRVGQDELNNSPQQGEC